MRTTLHLKKKVYRSSPWYVASPFAKGVPVLRRFGAWFRGKHPNYIKTSTYLPQRGTHFSDADTREAAAFYANLGPRNDRRYRGSY